MVESSNNSFSLVKSRCPTLSDDLINDLITTFNDFLSTDFDEQSSSDDDTKDTKGLKESKASDRI